ncbi:MAG: hypothetical protein GY874_16200 [Desulfobacteraceae bacterium]|nr:hypothetical protein [Desulfobacteraceae bacterium]
MPGRASSYSQFVFEVHKHFGVGVALRVPGSMVYHCKNSKIKPFGLSLLKEKYTIITKIDNPSLDDHNIDLAMPIHRNDSIIAVIVFGNGYIDKYYSRADLDALKYISKDIKHIINMHCTIEKEKEKFHDIVKKYLISHDTAKMQTALIELTTEGRYRVIDSSSPLELKIFDARKNTFHTSKVP